MKKIFLFALMCFVSLSLFAQETNSEESNEPEMDENGKYIDLGIDFPEPIVRDGAYDKVMAKEKIALSYDHIREADVFWSKRIWRVIDTRQKMNKFFVNEHQSFIEVLMDIIQRNPDVQLFVKDNFSETLVATDLVKMLGSIDTTEVYDMDTDTYITQITENEFNPKEYNQFRLKEDWIFDEESSTMVCRILGIAPIRDVIDMNTGQIRGQQALFWVYYPDLRKYLVKYEAFNDSNDALKMTWDDVFEARYFDSYISKESNPDDMLISDKIQGRRDALMESDNIKNEIFIKEHDLWTY